MGRLDEPALRDALARDPDAALAMVADLVHATDEGLRTQARRVATRLVLDRAGRGRATRPGVGRPRRVPAARGGDLDVDASLEAIALARAERRAPSPEEELWARDWGRPDLALCLLVDHSGSMRGDRLAAAAVTAAACALRAPSEHAVVAFARDPAVLSALGGDQPPTRTVDRVLALRGHGVTGLSSALGTAAAQLASARARRRVAVLLSDCRATDDADPVPAARAIPELVILAPAGDDEQGLALARAVGARCASMDGADGVPALLEDLLR